MVYTRNIKIPTAIIKNGFYEKEYYRQTHQLPYNEDDYQNDKQLTQEQIDALFLNDSLDIKAIIDTLSYIINGGNRRYGYEKLLKHGLSMSADTLGRFVSGESDRLNDLLVQILTQMDIETQADMSNTIEQLLKERPDIQPYIKYKLTRDDEGRIESINTIGIGRNGDFTGSYRVYLRVKLPTMEEMSELVDNNCTVEPEKDVMVESNNKPHKKRNKKRHKNE